VNYPENYDSIAGNFEDNPEIADPQLLKMGIFPGGKKRRTALAL
jgi:hypothetical protein